MTETPNTITFVVPETGDKVLDALAFVRRTLEPFTANERRRVLRYLQDELGEEAPF